jgi:hypothetical protein
MLSRQVRRKVSVYAMEGASDRLKGGIPLLSQGGGGEASRYRHGIAGERRT